MTENTFDGIAELADAAGEPSTFTPNYEPIKGLRILRSRLRADEGGTATVVFRGQVADATTDLWVDNGSLYAEVHVDDTTATSIRVALVPTGKRVPAVPNSTERALRLGAVDGGRVHVYLLAVDGTVDRAALDAEWAQRKAERREAARRAEAMRSAGFPTMMLGF